MENLLRSKMRSSASKKTQRDTVLKAVSLLAWLILVLTSTATHIALIGAVSVIVWLLIR